MVAVHGSGYCTSAFHAAKLILNNILRIAAVNTVGDALLWVGKVYRRHLNSASSVFRLCQVWTVGMYCNSQQWLHVIPFVHIDLWLRQLLAWHVIDICFKVHVTQTEFVIADISNSRMWRYCLLDE